MNNKGFKLIGLLVVLFIFFAIVGEVMCIIRCVSSDWYPPYKREIIYGVSALTGLGIIVGYINISDMPKDEIKNERH